MALPVGLTGCEEKAAEPSVAPATTAAPTPTAKAAASATTTTAAVAESDGAEYKDEDVPVEADFEEQADKEITDANYAAELATLEKELADAPAAPEGVEASE
ncbi:MAG: hypothetical protein EXR75_02470 [Myxococcales bacterium]|nr:hypothetical protein [Myxococcales bacterium]